MVLMGDLMVRMGGVNGGFKGENGGDVNDRSAC